MSLDPRDTHPTNCDGCGDSIPDHEPTRRCSELGCDITNACAVCVSECDECAKPFCDEHMVFFDGEGLCMKDARITFDAMDHIDTEASLAA